MIRSRGSAVLALVLLVVAVLLSVGAAGRGSIPLPVVAHLGGAAVPIGTVRVALAVVVPPLLVAVAAALSAVGRLEGRAVVLAYGAAAPIVLVLVARLNGVAEAVAIVLVYACSAGGAVLRSLHRPGSDPAPLRWWAVLGIVPWGVVAFTQIGGQLTGTPPSEGTRVLTLVVLAASIVEFVAVYRGRDAPPPRWVGLLLAALPGVLLALLLVAIGP